MQDNKKDNFLTIQASVLAAAIIISGSLLYSAHILTGGSILGNTAALAQNGSPANAVDVKIADRDNEPIEGASNAKVTIVEFADFQCPFCKSFWTDSYAKIKANYIDTGKVRLIYRHFPLPFHVNAEISAEAAECANQQGKFWEYYNILFSKSQSDGTNLDKTSLKSYAATVGLNISTFNSCLDSGATKDIVAADMDEGQKNGVSGTPTFYVNGKQIVGALPYASFQKAIDAALK